MSKSVPNEMTKVREVEGYLPHSPQWFTCWEKLINRPNSTWALGASMLLATLVFVARHVHI